MLTEGAPSCNDPKQNAKVFMKPLDEVQEKQIVIPSGIFGSITAGPNEIEIQAINGLQTYHDVAIPVFD